MKRIIQRLIFRAVERLTDVGLSYLARHDSGRSRYSVR